MSTAQISKDQYSNVIEYGNSHTNKETANHFGVSESVIENIYSKLKIKKGKRKLSLNDKYFNKIDSHDKAYILGFLMADGNVNSQNVIGWIILKKDVEILTFIKDKIEFSGEIKEYNCLKEKKACSLKFISKDMAEDLSVLGCTQNKSLTLQWPSYLEGSPFIWSFLLGYFDGDGWISVKRKKGYELGLACSEDFSKGLVKFLSDHNIKSYIKKHSRTKMVSVLLMSSHGARLAKLMMTNMEFSLKRKREKMQYIIFCYHNLVKNNYVKSFSIKLDSLNYFLENGGDKFCSYIENLNSVYNKEQGKKRSLKHSIGSKT